MFGRFFKRNQGPPAAAPFWGDAFSAPKGPAAPILRLIVRDRYLPRLHIALAQRGLMAVPGVEGRWHSPLRVACTMPVPGTDRLMLVLAGHRMQELLEGLSLEAGISLRPGDDDAGALEPPDHEHPERVWHIGLPRNWAHLCLGEDRQVAEAREAVRSRHTDRRTAGAATLARTSLMDRGPWVEETVVAWENSAGRGDLPLATLMSHELTWLRMAQDPLAPRLLAFLWALAEDRDSVKVLIRDLGARPPMDEAERKALLRAVPAEVAAAAMGLPQEARSGFAGEARYRQALEQVQDPATKAGLRVEAAQVLLDIYGSGWNVPRLESILELLKAALTQYADGQPTSRAHALLLQAETLDALGRMDLGRASLEEAARLIVDHKGLPRDPNLAMRILARMERFETMPPPE